MIRPIQAFEDNIRPAQLMLQVYRLLDCGDDIKTEGHFLDRLRELVSASATEDLMLVQNEIFLGLVRERSQIPRSALKSATLSHLLRQAIVASCTALDAYLPAILRLNLPEIIRRKGRAFALDEATKEYWRDLQFSLDEVLRLRGEDEDAAALFIANRLVALASFKYLSSKPGVHVAGTLLGLAKPWDQIAAHLGREKKELTAVLEATVNRRNDIVHRADRDKGHPEGEPQAITFAQASQGADTIKHVCLAFDELVEGGLRELRGRQPDAT
jgi:predicted house-cleaning noncanonical NTP pyrophosphatase (MazG superfamily)